MSPRRAFDPNSGARTRSFYSWLSDRSIHDIVDDDRDARKNSWFISVQKRNVYRHSLVLDTVAKGGDK